PSAESAETYATSMHRSWTPTHSASMRKTRFLPHLHLLLPSRRPLLRRLEQARPTTLDVTLLLGWRIAPVGVRTAGWNENSEPGISQCAPTAPCCTDPVAGVLGRVAQRA